MLGLFNLILVEHKPRLMCAWISGPHARDVEKIPKNRVFDQTKEFLHRFLGKTYEITQPTEMSLLVAKLDFCKNRWFARVRFIFIFIFFLLSKFQNSLVYQYTLSWYLHLSKS